MIRASAVAVNEIANEPNVSAMIGVGELDFSTVLVDKRNMAFIDDGLCALFVWSAPGVYECHVMCRPESRGRRALDAGTRMLRLMRSHGARTIWGQPSAQNRAAMWFVRKMGLEDRGPAENATIGPVRYFVMEDLQCRQL